MMYNAEMREYRLSFKYNIIDYVTYYIVFACKYIFGNLNVKFLACYIIIVINARFSRIIARIAQEGQL